MPMQQAWNPMPVVCFGYANLWTIDNGCERRWSFHLMCCIHAQLEKDLVTEKAMATRQNSLKVGSKKQNKVVRFHVGKHALKLCSKMGE
ncbi:hypothetical protein TNCV_2260751 [Trichonephila clavipes]|nr:hypothetical protein TNCV_2260751 [Trichonephila clavipes]